MAEQQKKTLSAKEVVLDVRAGATDEFLMKKYSISEKGLQSLFQKLVTATAITQADLDRRNVEQVEIIEEDSRPVSAVNSTQTIFRCPSCNLPQNYEFGVCPQCGVIVEKFIKKIQEQKAREYQMSRGPSHEENGKNTTTYEEAFRTPAGNTQDGDDPAMARKLAKQREAARGGGLSQSEFDERSQLFEDTVGIDEAIPQPQSDNDKSAAVRSTTYTSDSAHKLSKLKEALNAGILSAAEFENKKAELTQPQKTSDALEKLRGLLEDGILTEIEFESKKVQILGQSFKLSKLKEAFEAGILNETEYKRKKSELSGQAIPAASNRQIPAVTSYQSTSHSADPTGQTKFTLQIGETLIKEGYATYLKSTLNVFQGNGYLTSQRFVYCKKSTFLFYFLLGPLFGHLIKGKQVIFEIPLTQFSAISQQKHGLGKKTVLETKDGQQYGVGFISQDAWLKSIGETVISFVPGTTVEQDSERIDFISNSTGQPAQSPMSPGNAVIRARTMPSVDYPSAHVGSPAIGFTGSSGMEHPDIEPYYVGIFRDIENGRVRSINGYALLAGAFWYFYKGMWLKGLVYFGLAIVLVLIFPGFGALPVWVAASFNANWDYYFYKVHGENFFTSHWLSNTFPLDLQKRFLV